MVVRTVIVGLLVLTRPETWACAGFIDEESTDGSIGLLSSDATGLCTPPRRLLKAPLKTPQPGVLNAVPLWTPRRFVRWNERFSNASRPLRPVGDHSINCFRYPRPRGRVACRTGTEHSIDESKGPTINVPLGGLE